MERKRRPLPEELNIIRKVAWSYAKTNPGLDFEELFAEGCLTYVIEMRRYNPSKSDASTYIYQMVNCGLTNLLPRERKRAAEEQLMGFEMEELESGIESTPERHVLARERWEELFAELSPEAQVAWELINTTDTYLPVDKPKICRGIIIKLLKELGWGGPTIWRVFRELKQAASV